MIDLAAERIGGRALLASDEFFAEKENLLKPGRGVFVPDKYTDRGKWMDGWESRRKRTPGHDWCIVKLGLAGVIRSVDIDTNHFIGNHPPFASIDCACVDSDLTVEELAGRTPLWEEALPRSPLNPGSQNLFEIESEKRWTHCRLNIYPDGGVARLRVYGTVVPDWRAHKAGETIDLAAVVSGGLVLKTSDMFFGSAQNMIMPGDAVHMGDGWETRRRRGPGYDWAILKLGRPGVIDRIEVSTKHFKGNNPDECSIEGCYMPIGSTVDSLTSPRAQWDVLLSRTKLQPDRNHVFGKELKNPGERTHLRLNIYPDGGVSRFRVWGTLRG
jgi:allantoicase